MQICLQVMPRVCIYCGLVRIYVKGWSFARLSFSFFIFKDEFAGNIIVTNSLSKLIKE